MRILLSLLVLGGSTVWAAIPNHQTLYNQTLTSKQNHYIGEGVFTGGKAGTGSTILGVRRMYSAKAQIERVIVDVGDKEGKAQPKALGYFQASLEPENNRVVLDVSQLKMSKVSEPQLRNLFSKSAYVAAVEFTTDPEDQTGQIVLRLKQPVKLEVFELTNAGKPGRVVLDLTPVKTAALAKPAATTTPTTAKKVRR